MGFSESGPPRPNAVMPNPDAHLAGGGTDGASLVPGARPKQKGAIYPNALAQGDGSGVVEPLYGVADGSRVGTKGAMAILGAGPKLQRGGAASGALLEDQDAAKSGLPNSLSSRASARETSDGNQILLPTLTFSFSEHGMLPPSFS